MNHSSSTSFDVALLTLYRSVVIIKCTTDDQAHVARLACTYGLVPCRVLLSRYLALPRKAELTYTIQKNIN